MKFWRDGPFKTDLINYLGQTHGYRTYLEICTPTTGNRYAKIDRTIFSRCHRLMYRCPDAYDDGLDVDFRSASLKIDECIEAIRRRNPSYDVVLVDSFHEYDPSYRDITAALSLLEEGGTMVVHDCIPLAEKLACAEYIPGCWSGVSYKAYLDFVFSRNDLSYYTVDTDCGCGIVRIGWGTNRSVARRNSAPGQRKLVVQASKNLGNDYHSAYHLLRKNKKALLNLVSVNAFKRSELQLANKQ